MLSRSTVSELQKKAKYIHRTNTSGSKLTSMTFEECLKQCQQYISNVATNYYRRIEDRPKRGNDGKVYN